MAGGGRGFINPTSTSVPPSASRLTNAPMSHATGIVLSSS
jgi:hypothetical protein